MVLANFLGVVLLMELIAGGYRFGADGLSMNYYVFNCPLAEPIVRSTVSSALQSDPTLAAALVRMHFHDCWIQVINPFLSLTVYALSAHTPLSHSCGVYV
jgi:peroxidase